MPRQIRQRTRRRRGRSRRRPRVTGVTGPRGRRRSRCRDRSGARRRAGRRSAAPSSTIARPFTRTRWIPTESAKSRAVPPGRSSTSVTSPVADRRRGRSTTRSAWAPSRDDAAVAQPEERRRRLGDQLHRPLERHEPAAAQRVGEEPRRVGRAAHPVEVRAGVGAAEEDVVGSPTPPCAAPSSPRRRRSGAATGPCAARRRSRRRAACRTADVPRSLAMSATTRPLRPSLRPEYVSPIWYRPQSVRRVKTPASGDCERSSRKRRTSGSRSFAIRSGTGRLMTVSQSGSMKSAQYVEEAHVHLDEHRHRERDDPSAPARPRSRRPRAARGTRSGSFESIVSTFQFSGRRAASVISAMSSTSSGRKPRRQPSVTYSSVVPSCSRTAAHSASTSSRDAHRDATGSPSPSECVNDERRREARARRRRSPRAAARPSPRAARGSPRCRSPSAPITLRRSAQCPTRNPALTPMSPSSRSRYSAKVDQFHGTPCSSAASGMPSTLAIIRRV